LARLVLARRARRDLLDLGWPLIDAIEDALGLLERDRPPATRSADGSAAFARCGPAPIGSSTR
jgi:hypothetical protein